MLKYLLFSRDGSLIQYGTCQREAKGLYESDGKFILVWCDSVEDPHALYYDSLTGAVKLRGSSPLFNKTIINADGVDEAVLLGLPTPCTVSVNGVNYHVTDGEFSLSSTTVGKYEVQVIAPSILLETQVITCE